MHGEEAAFSAPELAADTIGGQSEADGGAASEQADIMDRMDREQERLRKNVLARMRRIEGQIRGIQRMIENGGECGDILMQVRAARAALHAASRQVMKRYMVRCHLDAMQEEPSGSASATGKDAAMERLVTLLTGYLD